MATTVTIPSTNTDNCLISPSEAIYSDAHDAASAASIDSDSIRIGQINSGTQNTIYRGFLYFDTSTLPDDAIIISAKLRLTTPSSNWDYSDKDFNIVIRRNAAGTYPSVPLHVDDFNYTFYTSDLGSLNTANILSAGSYYIWLNEIGKSWINLTGTTKIALISSLDINAIAPTHPTEEYIIFRDSPAPTLTIVYSAEEYPTTTTQAAINVGKTYTTANGTLTDGGVATTWGFEYGLTEIPTWIISQSGSIGEQAFSVGIPGLEPETTYYYRAFCTNSFGTSYGDWVSFTTGTLAIYGMHEEDNTATINFYLSEDDGMTWGQKHGPYTTDQADIEVTKLLVRGSGKKKIKFESNVLTGISASIMVKLDLKAR